jgi:glycosyltransferase involved in cell wall biosynthesis
VPGSPPLRVLHFTYGHALYGAERWVLTLIKHLDPRRVESLVACLRDADSQDLPMIDAAKRLGVKTVIIDARERLLATSLRGLRQAMRAHHIDVVHSHGVRQDLIALLASRGLSTKALSTPHGWEAQSSLKETLRTLLNKLLFIGFDAVAPLSEELRASVLPFARKARIQLITNGVDVAEVEAARPIEGTLPGQSAPSDFVIGYIGRLIPGKGLSLLLESLARLPANGWCCLVIGDGPERERLLLQARHLGLASRVTFLGYRADRLAYLKRLDLFVLPSYREGTPRCLMEALVAGVPCLGSRIPGIESVLVDGVTGDTFAPGDAAVLARAISRHLRQPEEAKSKAEAGRALVYERFSAQAMAEAYERLYASLAAKALPAVCAPRAAV